MLVAIVCWVLAGIKLAELRGVATTGTAVSVRSGLDYGFGAGVIALGISLLLVQQFHGGH
jgi:hypothetical protein